MTPLLLKDLPRYECLLEAAKSCPDLDPSACEAYLHILRTANDAFSFTDENLARHQLSQGRFTVLMLLSGCGCDHSRDNNRALTPAALADRAGCARATMTGLIDTLERDSLVQRTPDPDDRRMMAVALTKKGHALLREVLPTHLRIVNALMAGLADEERHELVRLLGKVLRPAAAFTPKEQPSAARQAP